MTALSVHPKWANLIRRGKKTIELRTWTTNHRGPLLICATKNPPGPNAGHAVCVVNLVDVRPMRPHDRIFACNGYEPSLYAWLFLGLKVIEPFPVRGQQKLFEVNLSLAY
jgi:hypothetical protein